MVARVATQSKFFVPVLPWCSATHLFKVLPYLTRVSNVYNFRRKRKRSYQVGLISSEEALHTIMIELHLQVSSFNHLIVFRASSSRSVCSYLKFCYGRGSVFQKFHL